VVKQRMQVARSGEVASMVIDAICREGPSGFFAGLGATLVRDVPFALIQMPLFEELKQRHPWGRTARASGDTKLQGLVGMTSGGVAGAVAGFLTTPLERQAAWSGGGVGPVHVPADDASWHVGSGAEGPGSSASQGEDSSGTAAATSGAVAGGPEAEADINDLPQWAEVGLRTPEAALGIPVAAACVLAAAAAATTPPGPSGASDGAGPSPAAARRSRGPQRRQAGRTPQSEIAVPSIDLGHSMREAGQYAFCCRCGAFAKLQGADRAKGLKQSCGGRIPQGALATAGQKKKRLYPSRLLGRCDPYTGKPLG
ncbi:unnamed protein product, partial [Prorocentrum cordatum]